LAPAWTTRLAQPGNFHIEVEIDLGFAGSGARDAGASPQRIVVTAAESRGCHDFLGIASEAEASFVPLAPS
jgi:hypothetical protein